MIDLYTSWGFDVSWRTDEGAFAVMLLRQANYDIVEADLNSEARSVTHRFAGNLDTETPAGLRGSDVPARSGVEILEAAVTETIITVDQRTALKVLSGFHPDWRHRPGTLASARPVARALLARDLRRIGGPILRTWHECGRWIDSDLEQLAS